ncbi:MAG: hypothetical protein M3Y77_07240 [Actinomycetota bacterium]|nr:hypothetical protein [Actinomycetota bacterium]
MTSTTPTEENNPTMPTTTKATTTRPKKAPADPVLDQMAAATTSARADLARLRDHADDLRSKLAEANAALADHGRQLDAGEQPDQHVGVSLTNDTQYLTRAVSGAEGAVKAAAEGFRAAAESEAEHRVQHLAGGNDPAVEARERAVVMAREAIAILSDYIGQRNSDLAGVSALLIEAGSAVVGVDGKPAGGAPIGADTSSVFADGQLHRKLTPDQTAGRWLAAGLNDGLWLHGRMWPVEAALQPQRDFEFPWWEFTEHPAKRGTVSM